MKRNALIVLMALVSLNLLGQRNRDLLLDEQSLSKMKKDLSLTEDQVTQLQKINETFQEERLLLRADTAMSRDKVAARNTRIVRERNTGFKNVLTKEQFSKWMEVREGQLAHSPRDGRGASRDHLQQMKTALGLSNEQAENIMAINAHMSGEFRKLRSDSLNSREQRSAALKKIMANRNAKIKKVLTEEQYAKFLEYDSEAHMVRRRGQRTPAKK